MNERMLHFKKILRARSYLELGKYKNIACIHKSTKKNLFEFNLLFNLNLFLLKGLFWYGVILVWGYFGLGLFWFGVIMVWGYFGGVISVGLFRFGVISYWSQKHCI